MWKENLRRLAQEIVGELVDAGVDAVAQKVREVRAHPQPTTPDPEEEGYNHVPLRRPDPPVVRLSRGRCKHCGSALFFARSAIVPGVIYECRSCGDITVVPVAEASNREGISL